MASAVKTRRRSLASVESAIETFEKNNFCEIPDETKSILLEWSRWDDGGVKDLKKKVDWKYLDLLVPTVLHFRSLASVESVIDTFGKLYYTIPDETKSILLEWSRWDDEGVKDLKKKVDWKYLDLMVLNVRRLLLTDVAETPAKRSKTNNTNNFASPAVGLPKVPDEPTRKDLLGNYIGSIELLQNEIHRLISETEEAISDKQRNKTAPAPFICLLQSIGYGKTRAIFELSKKRKVVYLIWKSLDGSWNVPEILEEILADVENAVDRPSREHIWMNFLQAVKEVVNSMDALAIYKSQFTNKAALGGLYKKIGEAYHKMAKSKIDTASKPQSILKNSDEKTTPTHLIETEKPGSAGSARSAGSHGSDKSVTFWNGRSYTNNPITADSLIVCMDEVTALSDSAYKAFRSAAKQTSILSIFVDTSASICQLASSNDHSSSENGESLGDFCKPLFALQNFDIHWHAGTIFEEGSNEYFKNLFSMGRPRWRSYLSQSEKSVNDLINLVTSLLTLRRDVRDTKELKDCSKVSIGDRPAKEFSHELQEIKNSEKEFLSPSMIAVFASRFSLGPASKIAPLLAKHSLATIVHISDDRSSVHVAYPSEPILAEASARYTCKMENRRKVLAHVFAAFNNSTKLLDSPRGDIGEMCAAALIGYALDKIREQSMQMMSSSVPLHKLLLELDCLILHDDKIDPHFDEVKNWEVNCTHFIRPIWEDIKEKELEMMWERHMAYYVPNGCPGLDMLLSIRHKSSKRFASLRVQVKNYSSKISRSPREGIFEKLLPENCLPKSSTDNNSTKITSTNDVWLDSVNLLLSVGRVEKACRFRKYDTRTTANNVRKAKLSQTADPPPVSKPSILGKDEKIAGRVVLELATHFPCNDSSAEKICSGALYETSSLLSKICAKDKKAMTFLEESFPLEKMRLARTEYHN